MEPLITPAESGRLDMAADDPPEMLMERAGLGVALMAVEMGVGYGDRVTVLAGRGNNGGDDDNRGGDTVDDFARAFESYRARLSGF